VLTEEPVSAKGRRTRARLVGLGVRHFGDLGFKATSVSALAREAGLTPPAAYAYFPDKRALWRAALHQDLDSILAVVGPRALASGRPFLGLMQGLTEELPRHPLARRVMEEGSAEDLRLVLEHPLFVTPMSLIAAGLRARQAAGQFDPTVDAEQMALGYQTVMFSLVLSTVRAGLDGDPARVDAVVTLLQQAGGGAPTTEERPQ